MLVSLLMIGPGCEPQLGPAEFDHATLEPVRLHPEVVFDDSTLSHPYALVAFRDTLIVGEALAGPFVRVIDARAGDLRHSFGRTGDGPGEFRTVWEIWKATAGPAVLSTFDPTLRRITRLRLDRLGGDVDPVVGLTKLDAPASITSASPRAGGGVIATGFFVDGRVALFDSTGKLESMNGDVPPFEVEVPAPVRQHVYQGIIVAHPDGRRFAVASRHASRIEILDDDGDPIHVVDGPIVFQPTVKIADGGTPHVEFGRETRYGYVDAAANGEHVYLLFSGRLLGPFGRSATWGRFVHVLDWNGQLTRVLQLDAAALGITIDEERGTLYAVRHEPRPMIVRYILPAVQAQR